MLFLVQNLCWVSVTLNKTPPLTTVCRSNLTWFLPPFPATAHLTHYTPASFFLYSLSSTGCSPSLQSSSSGSLQRWLFLTAQVSAQMASPIRPPLWYLLLQEPLSIISLCVCVCVCVCMHTHAHTCMPISFWMHEKKMHSSVRFLLILCLVWQIWNFFENWVHDKWPLGSRTMPGTLKHCRSSANIYWVRI